MATKKLVPQMRVTMPVEVTIDIPDKVPPLRVKEYANKKVKQIIEDAVKVGEKGVRSVNAVLPFEFRSPPKPPADPEDE